LKTSFTDAWSMLHCLLYTMFQKTPMQCVVTNKCRSNFSNSFIRLHFRINCRRRWERSATCLDRNFCFGAGSLPPRYTVSLRYESCKNFWWFKMPLWRIFGQVFAVCHLISGHKYRTMDSAEHVPVAKVSVHQRCLPFLTAFDVRLVPGGFGALSHNARSLWSIL